MMEDLVKLNHSLMLSEVAPLANIVMPFDTLTCGTQLRCQALGMLNESSSFHLSSIVSFIQDSLMRQCMKHHQISDLARDIVYHEQPNIVIPYLQVPYLIKEGQHPITSLSKDQLLSNENYISFITNDHKSEGTDHRLTYLIKGTEILTKPYSIRESHLIGEIEKILFKAGDWSQGIRLYSESASTTLPIPFPRFFTEFMISPDGLLKPEKDTHNDFVLSVASLLKMSWGSKYKSQA